MKPKFTLFENEKIIFNHKKITLTNYRVRKHSGNNISSILLDNVSSIEIEYKSNYTFLFISIIDVLILIYNKATSEITINYFNEIFLYLFLFFLALFLFSINRELVISSKGGSSISQKESFTNSYDLTKLTDNIEKQIIEIKTK